MLARIPPEELSAAWIHARAQGLVSEDDSAVILYDLARIKARARSVIEAFPAGALHAGAVKANPLPRVLQRLGEWGLGLEAASLGELELARGVVPPERIVFDSPAKTRAELAHALRAGVFINADSFAELERLHELIMATPGCTPRVGLRLNPQVGTGRFAYTSTAAQYSKFGVPIAEYREQLIETYRTYPWLQGVHVHIGSQACAPEQMVEGIRVALDFALEVNARLSAGVPGGASQQGAEALRGAVCSEGPGAPGIRIFDIGGGLPVSYASSNPPATVESYASLLRARCPELFDGRLRLVTEFGRYLHANAGWTASRVEYVKAGGGARTLILHVGADLLLRECYFPDHWRHEMVVLDRAGSLKAGAAERYVIAGPLCFAGDVIAYDVELPQVEEGDMLVIRDTGAYTLAMWSRFVSRQSPKVIGYDGPGGAAEILRDREDLSSVLAFWR